jgi:hypothetical protein
MLLSYYPSIGRKEGRVFVYQKESYLRVEF